MATHYKHDLTRRQRSTATAPSFRKRNATPARVSQSVVLLSTVEGVVMGGDGWVSLPCSCVFVVVLLECNWCKCMHCSLQPPATHCLQRVLDCKLCVLAGSRKRSSSCQLRVACSGVARSGSSQVHICARTQALTQKNGSCLCVYGAVPG